MLTGKDGRELARGPEIRLVPEGNATFTLRDVTIGINFHWERKEDQTFEGGLRLLLNADGTITAINDVGVEQYLKSVISSEMSAEAPIELLRAHAITSRSWLVAMLERQKRFKNVGGPARRGRESEEEIVRWYDREDHKLYDVCADDHCQRYHGITKIISASGGAGRAEHPRGVPRSWRRDLRRPVFKVLRRPERGLRQRVGGRFRAVSPDGVRRRRGASAHLFRSSRRAVGGLLAGGLLQHDRREHPPAGPARRSTRRRRISIAGR